MKERMAAQGPEGIRMEVDQSLLERKAGQSEQTWNMIKHEH